MSALAEAVRALFTEAFIRPDASELEVARSNAEAARALGPFFGGQLQNAFDLHMREVIRRAVIDQADLRAGRISTAEEVAVAFADLVDFTRLGERVPPDELGRVAGRLADLATHACAPPVRLVKTIGDAAMLVAPAPEPLLTTVFALLEAVEAAGDELPQVRAGVAYGPALNRWGDWYGRPVNLASRITGVARPGSVLVAEEVRAVAGKKNGFRWSFAGERHLKGVKGDVRLYRARPADADQPGIV
jgi:adenylate cyclase